MSDKKKKKLLILSDDIRVPSGVGTMTRRIVMGLKDEFEIIQLGGAIDHPNPQPVLVDGIKVIPVKGYGNSHLVRNIITMEQPDYMMIFTDPRYWVWLWQIEDEIRSMVPLMYYHLWDDFPAPKYNREYYLSNDWMGCISKISKAMVEEIAPEFKENPWRIDYIPHGTPENEFKPVDKSSAEYQKFLREYYKGKYDNYEFILFYNNRNVRRKMMGDVMESYDEFLQQLPEEKRDKCLLVMHTHVVDQNGTDLAALKRDLYPDNNILFSETKVNTQTLNFIYNSVDVTINLASNEGYGMATAESLMAGTPIITTITGGLQDQLGLDFGEDEYLTVEKWKELVKENIQFMSSPHAIGLIPRTRSLQGSPPTPYIFDDRINWLDAAHAINIWYEKTREERKEAGQLGRKYLIENGHTVTEMNKRFKKSLKAIEKNWTPIQRVHILEV